MKKKTITASDMLAGLPKGIRISGFKLHRSNGVFSGSIAGTLKGKYVIFNFQEGGNQ